VLGTALETTSVKASATSWESSSHTLKRREALVVVVGSDDPAGAPTSVKHNGRDLRLRRENPNATATLYASLWIKPEYNRQQTGTVVVTWGSAVVEKVVSLIKVDTAILGEANSIKDDTSTTSPGTGITGSLITAGAFVVGTRYQIDTPGTTDYTLIGAADSLQGTVFTATGVGSGTGDAREALTVSDGFALAAFLARGPGNDTPGTLQFDIGGLGSVNWTAATVTTRAGTAGAPPVSNVTLMVGWLQLADEVPVRARITGAGTARQWANILWIAKERFGESYNVGISWSDVVACDQLIADAGGNANDLMWAYDEGTGFYSAFEQSSQGTLRGVWNNDTGTWEAP